MPNAILRPTILGPSLMPSTHRGGLA